MKTVIRKLSPTKSEDLGLTDYILVICRQETTSPYLAKPDLRLVVDTAGHSQLGPTRGAMGSRLLQFLDF